jgi:hypothetical protein
MLPGNVAAVSCSVNAVVLVMRESVVVTILLVESTISTYRWREPRNGRLFI